MLHTLIHAVIEIHNPHQNAELVDSSFPEGDDMGHKYIAEFDSKK